MVSAIVAVTEQLVPPVTQELALNEGAANPDVCEEVNATESTLPKPGKPFSAVADTVIWLPVDAPCGTVIDDTLDEIATHGMVQVVAHAELLNVAVWAVSLSGVRVPFGTVTQTPPEILVCVPQPVWNVIGTPDGGVSAAML